MNKPQEVVESMNHTWGFSVLNVREFSTLFDYLPFCFIERSIYQKMLLLNSNATF